MISVEHLSIEFSARPLFTDVSFVINDRDRIALTGKNGAGKSTLMKIIAGQQAPTSGSISSPRGTTVGYLPQVMQLADERTVMEETMTAFDHITSMQRELEDINVSLSERTDYESESYLALINRLNDLTDALAIVQNEPVEVLAQKTLLGLGFKDEDFGRRTETFSQGWNMRIELAKVLLSEPDLLRSERLDVAYLTLEDFLKAFRGSLLLVSHDRKFLDNVTNRTVEIVLGHIYDYKVPYSQYVELHKERVAQQQAAYANQQRMIEKTEVFINKFRYKPTKSNQVQSRIKQLEKLERLEIDETDNATLTVKFPPAPRSGDIVFKGSDLTVGYPGKVVFTDAEIEVKRGEKVALIGRNGEGKTTLMRVIAGELTPISGTARTGHNVSMGYYAQNQEDALDRNLTVFETLDNIAVGEIRTRLRDILAQFLFRGEDIDKKVSVLSGGERARLGMARFMLQPYNLLALDEPTNHMDIKSKDILKQALKAYDGTLIVVSHDRDFLDGLVDKMYEFRDGKVKEHVGSVAEFLEKRKIESLQELERRFGPSLQQSGEQAEVVEGKEKAKQAFQQRRSESKELRRMKHRVEFLEGEIGKIESVMKDIEKVLSNPTTSDDIMELTRTYLENKRELDRKTAEWTSLMEQIEESNF